MPTFSHLIRRFHFGISWPLEALGANYSREIFRAARVGDTTLLEKMCGTRQMGCQWDG
jgi:hypothetical protein